MRAIRTDFLGRCLAGLRRVSLGQDPLFVALSLGGALLLAGCSLGSVPLFDQDEDGVPVGADCDDTDPSIGLGYPDQDGDGFAPEGSDPLAACGGAQTATALGDCDDADPSRAPGKAETCDGEDEDCDGGVDEALTVYTYFTDRDGDTYGDPDTEATGCALPPGVTSQGGDCDDGAVTINPGTSERCDTQDNDCDSRIDEGLTTTVYAPDKDLDGYGDAAPSAQVATCQPPPGYIPDATDCDDQDGEINPGSLEFCDGIDEDCDGAIDEEPLDGQLFYEDKDGDGWGVEGSAHTVKACARPPGYAGATGDCNDAQATIAPDEDERCNTADDDCDGRIDEGFSDSDGSGVVDCAEVAVVISRGFYDDGGAATDCASGSNLDAELGKLTAYLEGMGLHAVVRYALGVGISITDVEAYPLIIYHSGGNNEPPTRQTVEALITLRDRGKGLLFIGDDLGSQAFGYDQENQDRRLFDLLMISAYTGNGLYGRGAEVVLLGHPLTNGPYGVVSDFDYRRDLDAVVAAGRGEVVPIAVEITGTPAVLAGEGDIRGQRTVVMLPDLYATANFCEVSDGAGLTEIKSLFQNSVSWVLGL